MKERVQTYKTYGAARFLSVSNAAVREEIMKLRRSGLVDVAFGSCGDSGSFFFQSEMVYYTEEVEKYGEKKKEYLREFNQNSPLRAALTEMLEPFSAETSLWTKKQ